MDRSYPYTRRLIRRARLQQRAVMLAVTGFAGCAVLYGMLQAAPGYEVPRAMTADAAPRPAAITAAAAGSTAAAPRRIYPYSIVPGGVSGQAELARVVRTDKVVAAHYASFDVDKAVEKTVVQPRAVHVSYRKGDQVYWTAKKVMLAEGETLLSDGSHEVRARCANRISDTPQFPVEAHEPSAEELDSSVSMDSAGNVSAAMPDGGDGGSQDGPVRFLNAPGSGGSGTTGGGSAAPASSAADTLSMAAAHAGLPPLVQGGTLSAKSSSASGSTGSRPAPAASDSASVESGAGSTAQSPGDPASPADPASAGPGGPSAISPGTLPAAPAAPSTGSTPTSDAGLPETLPGVGLPQTPALEPGELSGGGDNTSMVPASPTFTAPVGGIALPPSKAPSDSPVPEPSFTPPVVPGQATGDKQAAPVPEPATLWLVGAALVGMLAQRRRAASRAR